uniref:G-protein coupled receptors family 1 profile domain-containing protein n=1 Tax=Cyprinus carpio TaxID=7962 RepID=A0A8C1Z9Y5_CYPCA
MSTLNASFVQNMSIVRPEYFFIIGLSGIPYSSYYYIFLFITYFIAVIGNSIVLLIIALERSLHSPKYIGVFNLALADIAVLRILSAQGRLKTFSTCSPQLIIIALYFLPRCFIYLSSNTGINFSTDLRLVIILLYSLFLSMINPLIYCLTLLVFINCMCVIYYSRHTLEETTKTK